MIEVQHTAADTIDALVGKVFVAVLKSDLSGDNTFDFLDGLASARCEGDEAVMYYLYGESGLGIGTDHNGDEVIFKVNQVE